MPSGCHLVFWDQSHYKPVLLSGLLGPENVHTLPSLFFPLPGLHFMPTMFQSFFQNHAEHYAHILHLLPSWFLTFPESHCASACVPQQVSLLSPGLWAGSCYTNSVCTSLFPPLQLTPFFPMFRCFLVMTGSLS